MMGREAAAGSGSRVALVVAAWGADSGEGKVYDDAGPLGWFLVLKKVEVDDGGGGLLRFWWCCGGGRWRCLGSRTAAPSSSGGDLFFSVFSHDPPGLFFSSFQLFLPLPMFQSLSLPILTVLCLSSLSSFFLFPCFFVSSPSLPFPPFFPLLSFLLCFFVSLPPLSLSVLGFYL